LAGNDQIGLGLNIVQDISNSDLILTWANIASRPEIGVQLFHFFNFFQTTLGIVRSRYLGVGATFNYPLSRFKRLELSLNATQIREEFLQVPLPTKVTNAFPLTSLAYVSDNTLFRFFGPFTGTRYRFGVLTSPNLGSNAQSFVTGVLDYRHYFGITRDMGFAWRLSGGASGGKNPMRFLLGGMDNWLNYQFAQDLNAFSITDFYFSAFITPLRGADYYESIGTRYFLLNAELRFPLVDYFITRFPLPLGVAGIRGAGFVDAGSAWESDKHFRALKKGKTELQDIIMGYGWGFRAYLGFILLRMDVAWRTDLKHSSKPRYLFSFGTDF
jgi:outer membrane protein assembly factor BamA